MYVVLVRSAMWSIMRLSALALLEQSVIRSWHASRHRLVALKIQIVPMEPNVLPVSAQHPVPKLLLVIAVKHACKVVAVFSALLITNVHKGRCAVETRA